MKLIQLNLENFRGIEKIDLNISGENLVLIGSNGVGKSSVLDATNILLSRIVELIAFGQPKRVSIKDSDITNGKQLSGLETKKIWRMRRNYKRI